MYIMSSGEFSFKRILHYAYAVSAHSNGHTSASLNACGTHIINISRRTSTNIGLPHSHRILRRAILSRFRNDNKYQNATHHCIACFAIIVPANLHSKVTSL